MSPRLVCALERFGECSKSFYPRRAWQRCCSAKHTKRLGYLLERKAMRRRKAKGRTQGASNAPREHSTRFSRIPAGKSASLANVLGGLATARPGFFLRLAAGMPKPGFPEGRCG
jgi:hypothetical protein